MIIKNGDVLLFKNDDVIIEKKDIKIKDGIIVKIGQNIKQEKDEKVIDATKKVVMPGLINTHCHVGMSIFRGTFEGCNLDTWLNKKVWPVENELTKEDIYNASMLSFLEMISTGTTCVNDHYFMSDQIRKAAEKTNMRIVLTRVIMDIDGDKMLENRIKEFKELYETRDIKNDLITYTISPHSFYTCSPKCIEKCKELALEYKLPIHIHFLESSSEIKQIEKLHKKKAVDVLDKNFGKIHTILAHGVKLNDEDIKKLKKMDVRNIT